MLQEEMSTDFIRKLKQKWAIRTSVRLWRPAQACESEPIRADWTFQDGGLKRQEIKQSVR